MLIPACTNGFNANNCKDNLHDFVNKFNKLNCRTFETIIDYL